MIVRNCAGGVVFSGDKTFILQNEKGEWVFPKGVIHSGELPTEVAVRRVLEETGVNAEIVSPAGSTNYEFFSVTRQKPVCNKIIWYIMESSDENYNVSREENFIDGGYFDIEDALKLVTYSQDRALLHLSFRKFKELVRLGSVAPSA